MLQNRSKQGRKYNNWKRSSGNEEDTNKHFIDGSLKTSATNWSRIHTKQGKSEEEILKLRMSRFKRRDLSKEGLAMNGFVSRGGGSKLQESAEVRQEYFKHILALFLRYTSKNKTSKLRDDFMKLSEQSEFPVTNGNLSLETPSLDSILIALRKLREAMICYRMDDFSKKVFLFSVRFAACIGHYQTYIPSINFLLKPGNISSLSGSEAKDISILLVLHTAHFNKSTAMSFRLYFKYHLDDDKIFHILRSWATNDYFNWIRLYNSEIDHAVSVVMKFGLPHIMNVMLKSFTRSYFNFSLKDFQENYLPKGYTYEEFNQEFNTNWKVNGSNIVVRERLASK